MSTISHSQNTYFLPAEWYPQSGVQLTWPHIDTDWEPYIEDITEVFVQLTEAIARYEKVLIVAQNQDEVKSLLTLRLDERCLSNVIFYSAPTNDTWARDHAAITLISTNTENGFQHHNLLLDFHFNGWGKKFAADKDNAITSQLYFDGMLSGQMEEHSNFVLEGGAIESDGEGTIFTTSQCLLAPNRNQPWERAEIEAYLKKSLRADRIVWLDYGNLIGDDTDGHIDTIVRVAPNQTLVYVGCDDENDEQYADFKALEEQLFALRTKQNAPYNLLKLPMPDAIYEGSERLPATYANYLIINGAVICPIYNQPEKDKLALDVIKKAHPDHDIIALDACTIIKQHGSIHCLTMQFPQGVIQ